MGVGGRDVDGVSSERGRCTGEEHGHGHVNFEHGNESLGIE
jgi:hypothetical protein